MIYMSFIQPTFSSLYLSSRLCHQLKAYAIRDKFFIMNDAGAVICHHFYHIIDFHSPQNIEIIQQRVEYIDNCNNINVHFYNLS